MNEPPRWLRAHGDGVRLQIKVVARASRNEIGEALGDRLKIKIAAPPVDSAANEELVVFLAKRLGVSRGAVQLTHGPTSRNKTVVIRGVTVEQVTDRLRRDP
jgi:uncharacterized protein (TIGR00251 family)